MLVQFAVHMSYSPFLNETKEEKHKILQIALLLYFIITKDANLYFILLFKVIQITEHQHWYDYTVCAGMIVDYEVIWLNAWPI